MTIDRSRFRTVLRVLAGLALAVLVPALAAAQPATWSVGTEAQLRTALTSAAPGDRIFITANITLTADLPSVGTSVTIDGGGFSLSGNNQFRGLFVAAFAIPAVGGPPAPTPIAVTIQNLTISNTVATGGSGGAGGAGGGGGAGLGGALFVGDLAAVSVSNVNLAANAAVGGAGGAGSTVGEGGGGGGLGGNGGSGPGGGGGVGVGAAGGNPSQAGLAGIITGVAGGGGGGTGGIPLSSAGSGGGVATLTSAAGFGGGGGGEVNIAPGGYAPGGFGGGGGGVGTYSTTPNGVGGFGGGGGGNAGPGGTNAGGSFGGAGGTGTTPGGGGGAGLGGAIFVQSGGSISINGGLSINGSTVTAGVGATGAGNGTATGSGIFLQGNLQYATPSLTFAPAALQTATVSTAIVDELGALGIPGGAAVNMSGAGRLVLGGNNLYSGGTNIYAGTLSVSSNANLGLAGTDVLLSGGTLELTATRNFARNLLMGAGTQTVSVTPGQSGIWSGAISESDGAAGLNVTGGGTLALSSLLNSYTLGTSINGNSTVLVADDASLGAFSLRDPTIGTVTLGDATSRGTLALTGATFLSGRAITLQAGGGTVDVIGATDASFGGVIDGAGGLTKDGTGVLSLFGASTYSGATTVNGGTLRAANSAAFGLSTSLAVNAGATADFNGFNQTFFSVAGVGTMSLNGGATLAVGGDNSNSSFAGTIDGTGSLIKDGSGRLSLFGTNTFAGGISLNNGTLAVSADANLGGAGAVAMANGTTLDLTVGGTYVHDLTLAGTASVNIGGTQSAAWNGRVSDTVSAGIFRLTGGGTLTLGNAANSYGGGTVVSGGSTLLVGADGALGAAGAGIALGDAASGGTLGITTAGAFASARAITVGAVGGSVDTSIATTATLSGAMDGSGGLTKTGAGTLTLAGTNTFGGGLAVLAGTVNVSADANLGGSGAVSLRNATTLGLTASGAFAHGLRVAGTSTLNAGVGQSVSWDGLISDGASAGTLRLTGGGLFALTNAANNYTGGTAVAGGSALLVAADNVMGAAGGGISLGDGGSTGTLGLTTSGSFLSSRAITLGALGGALDTAAATDATFSGVISGSGGLSKNGTGTLTLSGTNTFGGGVTLNGGRVNVASDANLGGLGAVTMLDGTTLGLAGGGAFAHALQMLGTGSLSVGAGQSATWNGLVNDFGGPATLQVTGGGLLALTNTGNTYTGGTVVTGDSTVSVASDNALGLGNGAVTLGDGGSNGTLRLTTTGAFVSARAITFEASGGTIDTSGATVATLNGDLDGEGGLYKTGAGTLTLSGDNTFGGGLWVAAGRVNVSANMNLGGSGSVRLDSGTTLGLTAGGIYSHALVVANGSTLNVGAGLAATWSGLLANNAGAGILRLTGGGTLSLTNTANSYSGGTVVAGGSTLVVGADSALGSAGGGISLGDASSTATLSLTAAGAFTSSRAITLGALGATINTGSTTAATLSGVVGGSGRLIKAGGGTLTLSGANTFTGGVTVTAGALWGSISSLRGNIVNNSQVGFNQAADGTYAGAMSGSGSLVKTGAGALTLSGANTYSGGTLLSAGSIIGTTTSLQGVFTNNAALSFNQAFDGVFRGVINGTGTLTKFGLGTVSLSGPQGFTGLTWIREGTLAIDSGLAGGVRVDPGATLWGVGTIGGALNLSGSLLVPPPASQFAPFTRAFDGQTLVSGTQLPALIINGNLTTTAGSTIGLTLSPNTPPPLLVNGSANLVGTHFSVNINDPNPARSSTYLAISTTGGLQVSGGDITSPSSTLVPLFRVSPSFLMVTLLNLGVPLTGVATTFNSRNVAAAIDAGKVGATGDWGLVTRELTALSNANLDRALRALSGEIHASSERVIVLDGLSITDMVRNQVSSREHDGEDDPRASTRGWAPRPWFQLSGNHSSFSSGEFSGGTANVGGGGGGLDFQPSSKWMAGVGVSLSLGDLSLSDLSETSRLTSPRVFTYYGFAFGPFHIHWGGSLARSTTTTKRTIQFAALVPDASGQMVPLSTGVDRVASSDQVATTRDAWSDWQFTRKFGTWTFDGKLGLRLASYTRQAFGEGGADSISLDVATQKLSTREFNIDVHHFRHTGAWRPNIWLTYRRDFGESWTRAGANFAGNPDHAFEIRGLPIPRDTFQGLVGITMRARAGLFYTLEYQFMRNSDETRQSVRFKVRL